MKEMRIIITDFAGSQKMGICCKQQEKAHKCAFYLKTRGDCRKYVIVQKCAEQYAQPEKPNQRQKHYTSCNKNFQMHFCYSWKALSKIHQHFSFENPIKQIMKPKGPTPNFGQNEQKYYAGSV